VDPFLSSLPTPTPGLRRGERFSLCCALLSLMFLEEVSSCAVLAVAGSYPQRPFKASSVISALLLSIYI